MNTLSLSRLTSANMTFKPLSAIFNILLLAIGIAIILTLIHVNNQLDNRLTKDLQGIDLVVSGKGSPLQIILSSVFHMDIPTGNIPVSEANQLKANPLIKSAIPLALGDNYKGYRIVGTNSDYIAHYHGQLALGRLYNMKMEAVVGNEVAEKYHLQPGDKVVGAHGLINSNDLHTDFPYSIVGVLKPTGSILDRLVLTPVESVWYVHEYPDKDDPGESVYKKEHPWNEITSLLISYKSPLAAAQLPRLINKSSSMQAASPAFEIARLNKLMGASSDMLSAFGILLIGFSAFGFFITLYNSVNERKYDIALMRSLGATRGRIFSYIMTEVLVLGMTGSIIGVILTQMFVRATDAWIYASKHITFESISIFGTPEVYVIIAVLGMSILAGLLPALKAYNMNIIKTLGQA
jgi:putative ABC transport system permease protein